MTDARKNEDGRPRCDLIYEKVEVDAALGELGLKAEEISHAVQRAHWAHSQKNAWHPPTYGGINLQAWGTSGLREALSEWRPEREKWSWDNSGNFCRTIDPAGRIAIVVSSGSEGTGDPNRQPSTKNPKGTMSMQGVAVNLMQMNLFIDTGAARDKPALWFLLIHADGDEVRSELSLPVGAHEETRHVDVWRRRIIIAESAPPTPHDGDAIEIDVIRRTG